MSLDDRHLKPSKTIGQCDNFNLGNGDNHNGYSERGYIHRVLFMSMLLLRTIGVGRGSDPSLSSKILDPHRVVSDHRYLYR